MTEGNIQIRITYKKRKDPSLSSIDLNPEEYFDPLVEGENYQEAGIPKYNHTWEYLNEVINELEWTIEEISGTNEDRTIRTEFLTGGVNWMIHRKDKSGYEEIIHNTEIAANISHVIRTQKESEGFWTVNTNVVYYDSGTPNERGEHFTFEE